MLARSLSGLDAVIVNGFGSPAFRYAVGAVIETVGAWLSMLTFAWIAGALGLPAASVAIARRSYAPSPSGTVFHVAPVGVHVPAPAGEYEYATVAPASLLASSVTAPLRSEPAAGLFQVVVGGVRSTVHVRLAGVASVLPAASVARTSNVCEP